MKTHPRTRTRIAVLAITLPLLAGAASVAPASAEVRTITDPADGGFAGQGAGDIGTVRVRHGDKRVVFRVFAAPGGRLARFYDLWVDTNRRNKGPEFLVSFALETSGLSVSRAGRFGNYEGRQLCDLGEGEVIRQGVRLVVPRRCLRTRGFAVPRRIRTSVQTSVESANADWAPGVRRFGPWVATG